MTASVASTTDTPVWQKRYADAITDPRELLAMLRLPTTLIAGAADAQQQFAMRVPRGYAARMEPGNPRDPLLLQVLPSPRETGLSVPGYSPDPVGDLGAMSHPGLLHKYAGRALLIATGACAINCRYCFRRHFPYASANAASGHWQSALEQLARQPEIREVILSGGDPLVLADRRLRALSDGLDGLPHVRTLRIHTRLPVVLPERVDAGLLRWLRGLQQRCVVVLHCNHPRELDRTVAEACTALRDSGVMLLNQAVLLRGVNDDAAVLTALSERLFDIGVLPYYLHALDPVQGAAHFMVEDQHALALAEDLRRTLPGYLVPALVREVPGAPYKTRL